MLELYRWIAQWNVRKRERRDLFSEPKSETSSGVERLAMRKCFVLLFPLTCLVDVHAQIVSFCDKKYSAKIIGYGEMLVENTGKKLGTIKVDHDIAGGRFDTAGKLLVAYGIPYKVDVRSPRLNIFRSID